MAASRWWHSYRKNSIVSTDVLSEVSARWLQAVQFHNLQEGCIIVSFKYVLSKLW